MKIKVSELTGAALDLLVAKCWYTDRRVELSEGKTGVRVLRNPEYDGSEHSHWFCFIGSTHWEQAGPIIDLERIELNTAPKGNWSANSSVEGGMEYGPTALIAAMRCFVASKLGDEVEVPDELA